VHGKSLGAGSGSLRRRRGALDYLHEAGNDGVGVVWGGVVRATQPHGFLLGLDPSIHVELVMREAGVDMGDAFPPP